MRKKLISITLSIMLMFNLISVQYASANEATEILKTVTVDGVALGAGALGGAVALLAVLGVYVASENDAVRKSAVDFYNYCDTTNKDVLRQMQGTIVRVPESLYDAATHFCDSSYTLGSTLRRAVNFKISNDGGVTFVNASKSYNFPYDGATSITTDGRHLTFFSGGNITIDYSERTKNLPISLGGLRGTPSVYDWGETVVNGQLVHRVTYAFDIDVLDSTGKVINWHQCIRTYYVPQGVTIPGDMPVPVLEEGDYYDYTRTGYSVPVPRTANGDRVIAIPDTLGLEGVEVTGEMCVPVANAIPADIADDIVDYPDTVEGEEPTENLPRIDYPKMSIPPKLGLTRKFPFSIPWDLKNAVTTLVAEPKCPKWEINWDSAYFVGGGKTVIDFEKFETWAKIVRWGVLIVFNIGLIIATRKLIGAGG